MGGCSPGYFCTVITYVCVVSHSAVSDSLPSYRLSLPGSSAHGVFQARILEWVDISSAGYLPDPGIKPASPVSPVSPALAGRFFTIELPGKP